MTVSIQLLYGLRQKHRTDTVFNTTPLVLFTSNTCKVNVLAQYCIQSDIGKKRFFTSMLLTTLHIGTTGCNLPYEITQCLPATRHKWTHPTLTPDRQTDRPVLNLQYLPWRDGRLSWA